MAEIDKPKYRGQLPNADNQCRCEKEGTWSSANNFYQYKDGSKTKLCKRCLTMHVDNFDQSTYLWLLKELDVPYIPEKWKTLRDRAFAKNPNLNGLSVFGKYLASMKIKPWTNYGWADTQKLQEQTIRKNEARAAEKTQADLDYEQKLKEQYANGEISEAEYKTLMPVEIQAQELAPTDSASIDAAVGNHFQEGNFLKVTDLPDPAADLTEDDKKYLAVKWGLYYTPRECIELEDNYQKMIKAFGINDPDSENTLIAICKVNLKMNQSLDQGDLDGFTKLSRTYETLRKSANFTAAQNKVDKGESFDAVGSIVAFCEKEDGKIPQLKIEEPRDIIDKVIDDLKAYNKELIQSDPALYREIEDYLKKRRIQEEQKHDLEEAHKQGRDYVELSDQDIADFNDFQAQDAAADEEAIREESEE